MCGVLKKSITFIFLFFIGLFIASSFFIRAKYNYFVYGDTPTIEHQKLGLFLLLIGLLLALSVPLYRLCLKLDRFSPRIVIPVTLLISFAIQVGIIFAFPAVPTADSQTVLSLAVNMLYRNDYSSFQTGGYLYMFPFNFSIVLYLKTLLSLFPDNYLVIKLFNILFTLATTVTIYFIYKELRGKSKENDYGVLVFAATYIPALFMSNFIYNDVIATTLLTAAVYFAVRFDKGKALKHIVLASVFLAAGNYFRSVGAIVLIAVVIYLLLHWRSIGWKKGIASLGILAVLFPIPGWTQNTLLQSNHIVNESVNNNSAPVYMWLHMGINRNTIGFWDNMQSYNIYQRQANYNKAKSTELFKAAIQNKLSSASAGDLIRMYYKKLIWVWTEGTYQLDRYGIGNDGSSPGGRRIIGGISGGYSYTTAATDLFKGDSAYRNGLLWVAYVTSFLMYGFIFIRLLGSMKHKRFDEVLLSIVVLGFIGFYLLWEIKSRYLYPVYPLLIVLSSLGYKDAYNALFRKNRLQEPVDEQKEANAVCEDL
jgi:hypothetical protein